MNKNKPLYSEYLYFPIMVIVGLLSLPTYLVGLWVTLNTKHSLSLFEFYSVVIIILVVTFVVINFYKLKIKIYNDCVEARFGIFSHKIKIDNIIEATTYKYTKFDFLGWGIRYGKNNTKAYNVNNDNYTGVLISTNANTIWHKLFISSRNPEKIVETIKKLKESE